MVSAKPVRLLLTGGGTGGHLFPAVATAQEFRRRYPDTTILFVGTRRKMDTTALSQYGFDSESIVSYGMKGKKLAQLIKAVTVLPLSYVQAVKIIRTFRPDLILGVGGYVTGPVVAAGKSCGVPTMIHEQNAVPGLANRKLGKIVDRVCLSHPGSKKYFSPAKAVHTGNPVRANILDLARGKSADNVSGKITLLVLGGSQGAEMVNKLVMEAFLLEDQKLSAKVHLIHQTGMNDAAMVLEAYARAGIKAEVQPFFREMDKVYAKSDLLISRAGATTLSEIAVLGKPAILIPYPYAADDHQTKNGDYYVQGGGARLYQEKELSPTTLAQYIDDLISRPDQLAEMGQAMKKLSFPGAA
ncbi:MAG: undecaprenyldiphospho-muramoylpentapeptide beta-N-acetylglucosaminyltransferase, partial [Deltaproteobacteria bacterium]|nr:undecaprenyldiphospho-muramoylpentapeptide beta-N-acetylglucosaminyltransferase [Deltaproteobacteria bacterium]